MDGREAEKIISAKIRALKTRLEAVTQSEERAEAQRLSNNFARFLRDAKDEFARWRQKMNAHATRLHIQPSRGGTTASRGAPLVVWPRKDFSVLAPSYAFRQFLQGLNAVTNDVRDHYCVWLFDEMRALDEELCNEYLARTFS